MQKNKKQNQYRVSRELLTRAYDEDVVKLVSSPNDDGTVCQIGEYWFYFGGITAEENSPEEYVQLVPKEEIITDILETIDSIGEEDPNEAGYYFWYLTEWEEKNPAKSTVHENLIATIGRRAGNMEMMDLVEIDSTVYGEDAFADFAARTARKWENLSPEQMDVLNFDELIEKEIQKKYKKH